MFSSISTTWGTGDGSSTFNLPDLRGQFVRGWDNSAGVDSGRSFASSQSDQNKQHTHSVTDPGHQHNTSITNSDVFPATGAKTISYGGAGGYPADTFTMSSATTGISLANQGGTEVRVKNYALMYVIKF